MTDNMSRTITVTWTMECLMSLSIRLIQLIRERLFRKRPQLKNINEVTS